MKRNIIREVMEACVRHGAVVGRVMRSGYMRGRERGMLKDVEEGLGISAAKLEVELRGEEPVRVKPVRVKRWIVSGELEGRPRSQSGILEQCGRLLDSSCSGDILGDVVFEGDDGRYYTVTVEAVVSECDVSYAANFEVANNN